VFEQLWLARNKFGLSRIICHEIGHNLGFGHGGTGVMTYDVEAWVSLEEIDAARAYWFA
jgi:hypothetical protein